MTVRGRVLEFLKYKNISRYKFYKMAGMSNGFLDKEGSMTTDNCEKIFNVFPELSCDWLILGRGKMLRTSEEEARCEEKKETAGDGNNPAVQSILNKLVELSSENSVLRLENARLREMIRATNGEDTAKAYEDKFLSLSSEDVSAAEQSLKQEQE